VEVTVKIDKMAESGNEFKDNSKDGGKPKPSFSPFSPFPYGSPLAQGAFQTSFSGSPGQRILLGSLGHTRSNGEVVTPRLKGQDLYGGTVMFGGLSSSRRTRLQSSSPYGAAMRTRTAERRARQGPLTLTPALGVQNTLPPSSLPSTAPSSPQSSPGPATSPPAPLSSTAKMILSTLDRLSTGGTPITDAKKIPLSTQNRAEKRKMVEAELNCSLGSPSRRRARLGGGGLALALSGPPLRKNYSPSLSVTQRTPAPSKPTTEPVNIPLIQSGGTATTPSTCPAPPGPSKQAPIKTLPEPSTNRAKSSFKVKTKVTEAARHKADLSSTEAPPSPPCGLSGLPQLKVDTMPVLNFSTTSATKSPPTTTNGLSILPPRESPEIIERNNNKCPLKRVMEEKEKCDSPKKQKSGVGSGISTDSVKPNHVNSTSANGTKTTEKVESEVAAKIIKASAKSPISPSLTFRFSVPKSVIDKAEVVSEAEKHFNFSHPSFVKTSEKVPLSNGPSNLDIEIRPNPNLRMGGGIENTVTSGLVTSSPTMKTNFKFNSLNSMPDVTNNLVKKSPLKEKIKGSNSRLPDITASTGFGGVIPAKELKLGSVMDILGFQNSGF